METNLIKAYSLIWEDYMAPAMIQKIEHNPDLESTIKDNPIELLKAIKASMYEMVHAQKPIITAVSALINLVTYRQKDNVPLDKYLQTFKELHDVFKTQWGEHITDWFVEHIPKYKKLKDDDKKKEMKEDQFTELMGLLFIQHADTCKYG